MLDVCPALTDLAVSVCSSTNGRCRCIRNEKLIRKHAYQRRLGSAFRWQSKNHCAGTKYSLRLGAEKASLMAAGSFLVSLCSFVRYPRVGPGSPQGLLLAPWWVSPSLRGEAA